MGVHLQLSPVNFAPKKFVSALGVHMHPVHPLATPMAPTVYQ